MSSGSLIDADSFHDKSSREANLSSVLVASSPVLGLRGNSQVVVDDWNSWGHNVKDITHSTCLSQSAETRLPQSFDVEDSSTTFAPSA